MLFLSKTLKFRVDGQVVKALNINTVVLYFIIILLELQYTRYCMPLLSRYYGTICNGKNILPHVD